MNKLKSECLAPTETMMFSAACLVPCAALSSAAAAARSSAVPDTGVYLPQPFFIAATAASLM